METAVIVIFVLLIIYMLLQTHMMYTASPMTDLDTERPVTWNYDWGGGNGYSRFLISGDVS